ncbi:hypothetical protein BJV78DRAFT_1283213 [Lactifluus subvellereus]|nr:hypothetical protein BJV78DRAFT_1283213 [Lactifluus subvellereus]
MCMTILELSHAEEVLGLIELALGGAVHVTVRGGQSQLVLYFLLFLSGFEPQSGLIMRSLNFSENSKLTTSPVHVPLNVLRRTSEEDAAATGQPPPPSPDPPLTVSENLRTIEVEAIQYLTTDYQPTCVQTAQGVQCLTKNLAPFGLTKAEQLQVVNLTPVEPVELYVVCAHIVSQSPPRIRSLIFIFFSFADCRGAERQAGKLHGRSARCRALLAHRTAALIGIATEHPLAAQLMLEIVDETPAMPHDDMDLDAPLWEHDDNEIEYIDAGEGVGIEGDLDLEDE